eukprot:gnl/TRDRNA2_/TRDRNA2_135937_c3_seq1.p1 gnl/TRDRNA2_/TRDRNA2_135937_c3~~gnl/TRDRNA2_/TRDRNA2_135937_c3_seq1.p1  ORF type:complete len:499 (+),score=119.76 gnl/TRDRNA2_/TRDRNA2_135937_c3_seq1:185-1498(+)
MGDEENQKQMLFSSWLCFAEECKVERQREQENAQRKAAELEAREARKKRLLASLVSDAEGQKRMLLDGWIAHLEEIRAEREEKKAKQMRLMASFAGQDEAQVESVFNRWRDFTVSRKAEKIANAAKRDRAVAKLMSSAAGEMQLRFKAWVTIVMEVKKLKQRQATLMASLAGNDQAQMQLTFRQWHQIASKERSDKKARGAQKAKLLANLASSDESRMLMLFTAWQTHLAERKAEVAKLKKRQVQLVAALNASAASMCALTFRAMKEHATTIRQEREAEEAEKRYEDLKKANARRVETGRLKAVDTIVTTNDRSLKLAIFSAWMLNASKEKMLRARTAQRNFLVDNRWLESKAKGLGYRFEKELDKKDTACSATWGSIIRGTDEGDGWVKVTLDKFGERYLPMTIQGKSVLTPQADDDGQDKSRRSLKLGQFQFYFG